MSQDTNRLYLVDSSIYVFRAWFTLPDSITDSAGNPANAVYGFTDFAYRLLDEVDPMHIAFAFDESLTTSYRNEIYPEYKANRESAPEELKYQFRLCREFLAAVGLTELGSSSYEADDLIGTLAKRERKKGFDITYVTGDKDLTQLVEGDDEWWEFAKDKRLDSKAVEKEFGVRPDQIADQLAIAGDKVDNIPGVPGIGMATAAKLLRKFDTIEQLLSNIERIGEMKVRGAARLQNLIDEHQDTVRLSRRLTGIHCNAELPKGLRLKRKRPDSQSVEAIFDKLGFGDARRARWEALLSA